MIIPIKFTYWPLELSLAWRDEEESLALRYPALHGEPESSMK